MTGAGPVAETVPWDIPALLVVGDTVRLEASFAATVRAFGALGDDEQGAAEVRFVLQQVEGKIRAAAIDKYLALLSRTD